MAAGDAYTARYDKIVKNFNQRKQCVDDTLLWDKTLEENFRRTCEGPVRGKDSFLPSIHSQLEPVGFTKGCRGDAFLL